MPERFNRGRKPARGEQTYRPRGDITATQVAEAFTFEGKGGRDLEYAAGSYIVDVAGVVFPMDQAEFEALYEPTR